MSYSIIEVEPHILTDILARLERDGYKVEHTSKDELIDDGRTIYNAWSITSPELGVVVMTSHCDLKLYSGQDPILAIDAGPASRHKQAWPVIQYLRKAFESHGVEFAADSWAS